MNSSVLFSSTLILALVYSSAALTCYKCIGKEADCPANPTQAQLTKMTNVNCTSTLSTVCAKGSINLLNGDYYMYRDCAPTYVGGTATAGNELCTFINKLYAPLVTEGLLAGSSCSICNTIDCNT